MLTQGLVLPRMKASKNREIFFLKKKREIEQSLIAEKAQDRFRQENDFIPYYLKTLNKIKRSRKTINTANPQIAESFINHENHALGGSCDGCYRTPTEQKTRHPSFNNTRHEEKRKSLNPEKKAGENLQIVISNGHSHDKTLPQKGRKRVNMMRFKKHKEKNSLTFRIIEAKTSRERQRSITIQDIGLDEVISKTKYLHKRSDKKHYLQEFENANFENRIKQLTPRKPDRENSAESQLQLQQPLKTEEQAKYQNLQRKYKSLVQGFSTTSKLKYIKHKVQVPKSSKAAIFNTFEISGW